MVELYDKILEHLAPLNNPPTECNWIVPPKKWRDVLFKMNVLPWLWDLDPEALSLRRSVDVPPYDDDFSWNWEEFVRQLAQVEAFDTNGAMANAPMALRNRRRIWRLVEESRLNDCPCDF